MWKIEHVGGRAAGRANRFRFECYRTVGVTRFRWSLGLAKNFTIFQLTEA